MHLCSGFLNNFNGNDRGKSACGRMLYTLLARSAATDPYRTVKMLPFIQFFHSQMMIGPEIHRILYCLHRAVQHNLIFHSIDGYVNVRTKLCINWLVEQMEKKYKTSHHHGCMMVYRHSSVNREAETETRTFFSDGMKMQRVCVSFRAIKIPSIQSSFASVCAEGRKSNVEISTIFSPFFITKKKTFFSLFFLLNISSLFSDSIWKHFSVWFI